MMINIFPNFKTRLYMNNESKNSKGAGETVDIKALRESRGVTLEALFNATKIRVAILEAIETGNFKMLPERIYSEAFIKSYAKGAGIDPELILSRYRKFLNVQEPGPRPDKKAEKKEDKKPPADKEKAASGPKPAGAQELKAPVSQAGGPRGIPQSRFSRKAVALILSVLVICAGFLYFLLSDDNSGQAMKTEKPPESSQASAPAPNPEPAAAPAPAAEETKPEGAALNSLVIRASELTWISIVEDGNQPYQVMLRPGDTVERVAGRFIIDIGNAGGISLSLNGNDMGVPGRSGQVVHLILPQENPPEKPQDGNKD